MTEPAAHPAGRLARRLAACGDLLSIWQTLYAGGLAILIWHALGLGASPDPARLAAVLLGSHSMFLLDRVKPAASLLDPADAEADPRRHGLIRRWGTPLRLLALASLFAGLGVALAFVSWIAAVAIAAGALGVLAYAGRRPSERGVSRLKDVPIVKNAFVGIGLTALVLACVLPGAFIDTGLLSRVLPAAVLLVTADAILCDIDDIGADRRFRVGSIAALWGARIARWTAFIVTGLAAAALASAPQLLAGHARAAWAIALVTTTGALAFAPLSRVKSLVDLRLPILAALIAAWLAAA